MTVPDPVRDRQFYEGVPLRRLAAFVVDLVVILTILGGILTVCVLLSLFTFGLALFLLVPGFALAGFLYRFTLLSERSATLGMMIAGIELRGPNGEPVDRGTAALHTLGFYGTLFVPILMIFSMLWLAIDPNRRMLHDLPLGTVMINRPL